MSAATRHRSDRIARILHRLGEDQAIDVTSLAAEFGVSGATVRRDLQMLADQNLLSRTHGGAVAGEVSYELPLRYRGSTRREEKRAIAARVADLLPKGLLVLGLSGGTTTTELARRLATRVDLTVVTNALNIATLLASQPRLKVIVTGGVTRTQSHVLVGPLAEQTLRGLHLEVVVVGADGVSAAAGLTTHDEVEAHTDGAMIAQARHVIVAADGSKIGTVTLARMCSISAVDELVTDDSADPAAVEELRGRGVTVHVVPSGRGGGTTT